MTRAIAGAVLLGLLVALPGCAVAGQGLGAIGQLVDLAISLAMAAAPFALSYWLYRRQQD